jgi:hypothetical protein
MSKKTDEQPKDPKPYERYSCQGRYMEPGTPWEQTPGLCSKDCDVRHTCWKMKRDQQQQQ